MVWKIVRKLSVGKYDKKKYTKFFFRLFQPRFSTNFAQDTLCYMYFNRKHSATSREFRSLKTWLEKCWASFDGKSEFSKRDLILDHLKRSKVTHLKVCLKLDLSFVSLKYIRFRQRLIWLCLRTVLPLLIQLFTWIKMSRYTDSKRKHQNTKNKPRFI